MTRSASCMLCLPLTMIGTLATTAQEAPCTTSCGISWWFLIPWAYVGMISDSLVQQSVLELLFGGSERSTPSCYQTVLDAAECAVDKPILQRSFSGDYGAYGAGCGHRDEGPSRAMQDVAVCRRDGRWDAATDVH